MKTHEIKDGKEDVVLFANGRKLITIHEKGYKAVGMTFEQAKAIGMQIGEILEACSKLAAKKDGT
jgi:hypothetical protein